MTFLTPFYVTLLKDYHYHSFMLLLLSPHFLKSVNGHSRLYLGQMICYFHFVFILMRNETIFHVVGAKGVWPNWTGHAVLCRAVRSVRSFTTMICDKFRCVLFVIVCKIVEKAGNKNRFEDVLRNSFLSV